GRQVVLGGELRAPVRRERQLRGGFAEREPGVRDVHRAPGGRKDDAAHTADACAFEQVEQTEQVDFTVPHRVCHRAPDVHLGGVVVQHCESAGRQQLPRLWRADVRAYEPGTAGEV